MGRVFNLFLRGLGLTRFRDTQCGFKGFTARAAETCFPRQTLDGFSFDAELLHIAAMQGLRVDEVPVRWLNSPKSRVNPLTDSTRMFLDLLRVRANTAAGRYA
jgi:dolichyl-phosphate beta-glucosyltransferase